jgi:hypothetical protein
MAEVAKPVEGFDELSNMRQRLKRGPGSIATVGLKTRACGSVGPGVKKKNLKKKHCAFLCGRTNECADLESPTQLMRWAYPDGSGMNDWFCERIWIVHYAHKWKSKKSLQTEMGKNVNLINEFKGFMEGFLQRRRAGKSYMARAGGVKRTTLKQKLTYRLALRSVEDDFWPLEDYKEEFGCVQDPVNKRRKHVKQKVNGIWGVIVPTQAKKGPMKIRREILDDVAKEDILMDGNSDEDVGPEAP